MNDSIITKGDELAGKVALVTGGARNIGRAIACALAAGGASVMVNANTSRAAAQETVDMIEAAAGKAALFIADVTDPDAVARMVAETVARFGRIDMLVNNAAVRSETPFGQTTLAEWRHIISTVLDGAFICSQAVLPQLISAGGGTIINIGGLTGHRGAPNRTHVVAAKGGLAAMTKGMSHDLAAHHITVNCVVPGTIETQRGLPGAPMRPENMQHLPPIGRRGTSDEIAAMVRMLCGPTARYVTGQAIHVNGGGFMP